jgi:cytochrome c5
MTRSRWKDRSVLVAMSAALIACDRAPATPPAAAPPLATTSASFVPVADMRQLMAYVVEPAAEVFWDAVGSVEDSSGLHALAPRTTEEWDAVRSSAYMVTESGNLMMMGTRVRDQQDWLTLSRAMIEAGKGAIKAAEARDTAAVFNAGAELYATCTACHSRYAIGAPRPSDVKKP